jgi:hypothetical protein
MKLTYHEVRTLRTLLKIDPKPAVKKMMYYQILANIFDVSRAYVIDIKRVRVRKGIRPYGN